MAYSRGSSANIIVGAAAFFVTNQGQLVNETVNGVQPSGTVALPTAITGQSYKDTLQNGSVFRNVGYTNNGVDITFTPTFGDVTVDQLLDVAKLYKSGMQVTLKTSFAEATLENLLLAIAQKGAVSGSTATSAIWTETVIGTPTGTVGTATTGETATAAGNYIDLLSGDLGDYPVERSIVAVGPGNLSSVGTTQVKDAVERIYVGYRAVSITNVTVSAKRDAATMFDVEFRLLPNDNGSYGKIIDRTY
jgi:hypothetical protein